MQVFGDLFTALSMTALAKRSAMAAHISKVSARSKGLLTSLLWQLSLSSQPWNNLVLGGLVRRILREFGLLCMVKEGGFDPSRHNLTNVSLRFLDC